MDDMSTPAQTLSRMKAFARTKSGSGVIRKLAVLWGILAIGAGVIIPAFAAPHERSQTFHATFEFIHPIMWGLAFLVVGASIIVTVAHRSDVAPFPLFALSAVIFVMAFTTSGTFFPGNELGGGGSPLVTWLLVILAIAILIVGSAVDIPEQDTRHHA